MSKALFNDLKPKDAGFEITGYGMKKSEYAFLASRETGRVDKALIAISLAKDETEVRSIFNKLHKDTVTALFGRWVLYIAKWKKMVHQERPHLWIPPKDGDFWRAIFLAMTSDQEAATALLNQIWTEVPVA